MPLKRKSPDLQFRKKYVANTDQESKSSKRKVEKQEENPRAKRRTKATESVSKNTQAQSSKRKLNEAPEDPPPKKARGRPRKYVSTEPPKTKTGKCAKNNADNENKSPPGDQTSPSNPGRKGTTQDDMVRTRRGQELTAGKAQGEMNQSGQELNRRGRKTSKPTALSKASRSSTDGDDKQAHSLGSSLQEKTVSKTQGRLSPKDDILDDVEVGDVQTKQQKRTCSRRSSTVTAALGESESGPSNTFSPRRSGRGTVPNSRFKDMHLFVNSKKPENISSKVDDESSSKVKAIFPTSKDESKPSSDKESLALSKSVQAENKRRKPFMSGAQAKAQARGQKQVDVKTKQVERISFKEVPEGLEVTGKDGIPVVVSQQNIFRVPCPTQNAENKKIEDVSDEPAAISGPRNSDQSEPETVEGLSSMTDESSQVDTSQFAQSDKPVESNISEEIKDTEETSSVVITSSTTDAPGVPADASAPTDDASGRIEDPENSQSMMEMNDMVCVEEVVVEASTSQTVADQNPDSSNPAEEQEIHKKVHGRILSTSSISVHDGDQLLCKVSQAEAKQDTGESSGNGSAGNMTTEPEVVKTLVSSGTSTSNDSSGNRSNMLMMAKLGKGEAVVLVDKTKKSSAEFLKNTLSSIPASKPGFIIASPQKSSLVKIVTLSSFLEGRKDSDPGPSDGKEMTTAEVVTKSVSERTVPRGDHAVSLHKEDGTQEELPKESNIDVVQDLETAQNPEDVATDLKTDVEKESSEISSDVLQENKVTETAEQPDAQASRAETDPAESRHDNPDGETSGTTSGDDAGDEKTARFTSSATQTPVSRYLKSGMNADQMTSASTIKTIEVNLGKHDLQEEESKEGSGQGPGQKPKSEEYILVQLPEGTVIQQKFVKSRTKIDDSMFLSSDSVTEGVYHCTLCNYRTAKKPNWYKHKKKHMGIREFACDRCEYKAVTSSNLKRHMAIHDDVRAFSCIECNMTFRQKIHLERHINYKHLAKQIKCPFCEYMCANENPDLKVHIKRRHLAGDPNTGLNSFPCKECDQLFTNKKDLKQHLKYHRSGPELKLFCEQCSFVTDCASRLQRHTLTHTKEKPFQCGLCDYRGSQKEHVVRHMRSQHQIEVVRRHRKPISSSEVTLEDGAQINVKDFSKLIDKTDYSTKDKIFACNYCAMRFSKLINLYKHLHTQHKDLMTTEEEDYACVVCDFHTSTKKNLLVHMRKHNMNDHSPPTHLYSCVLCRYTNPKRRNLFQHMRKKHNIEIVMKDDGSTSCFVTNTSNIQEDIDQNVLTVGDIVTTTTANTESQDDPTSSHNVISLEDLATMVAPEPHQDNLIIDSGHLSSLSLNPNGNDAAEAIEGLQALAGQINLAESVIEEVQVMDVPSIEPIALESSSMMSKEGHAGEKPSIQLSTEQLINLTSGDYVEINGEMYKVEISDGGGKATASSVNSVVETTPSLLEC